MRIEPGHRVCTAFTIPGVLLHRSLPSTTRRLVATARKIANRGFTPTIRDIVPHPIPFAYVRKYSRVESF